MVKKIAIYGLVFLLGGIAGWWLTVHFASGPAGTMPGGMVPSVQVMTLVKKPMLLGKTFIAKVEAINAANITPEVSGYIDEVRFKDGSFVKEGDVLFVIDQARYRNAVAVAEATLDKAKASLKQIQSNYNREQALFKDSMLSKADLEMAESNLATAKANVKAAQASLDLAKLDMDRTEVRSPINGYIGKAFKTKGNQTAAGDPLARVIQMDPIRVVFSMTDKERLSGLDQLTTGTPDLQIALPNGETIEMPHATVFADNEINAQTATIAVYAQTDNAANKLIPGNYVNVKVSLDKLRPMLLIPQTAVAQDAAGQYVTTVDEANTVGQKYVTLGDMLEGQYIVISGLEEGERIVPIGQQKLQPGMQVNTNSMNAAAPTGGK